jgi:nucleotide-binding universal stress UspA family protein
VCGAKNGARPEAGLIRVGLIPGPRTGLNEQEATAMYKKVLVTLDQSQLSEAVLPHLRDLLEGSPAVVTLLAVGRSPQATKRSGAGAGLVIPPTSPEVAVLEPAPPIYAESRSQAIQRREHELQEYLESVSGPIRETGSQVRTVVRMGEPEKQIIDFAREGGYDLIVMATHGRSGLSEFVQGSIAEAVVKSGVAPVLLVRPRKQ